MIVRIYYFLLIILIFNSAKVFPQLSLKLNNEFGYFNSTGESLLMKNDMLARFEGQVNFQLEEEGRSALLQVRARPEFFGFDNTLKTIKVRAAGEYYQYDDFFSWGINALRQRNIYLTNDLDFNIDIFSITADLVFNFIDQIPFNSKVGYAYQRLSENTGQELDIYYLDLKFFNKFDPDLTTGFGIFVERFDIENRLRTAVEGEESNSGWRVGPQVSFNYFKNLVVNLEYRFLLHISRFTQYPSYEHWVRLIAGKIFLTDFSVFLLVDYYSRQFVRVEGFVEGVNPLYTPMNIENRIYIKLAYSLSDNFELYVRSGYFRENLFENDFSLEGWNILSGLEFNL